MKKVVSLILSLIMLISTVLCVDLSAYALEYSDDVIGVVDYSDLTQNQYISKILLNCNYLGSANDYNTANQTPESKQLDCWMNPNNVSFSRILVNALQENSDFMSSVEAWEILTFNPKDLAEDAFKEEDYYTTILLSILDAKVSDNEFIKNLNCSANKTITSLSKNTAKILKEFCAIDIENLENVNIGDLTDSQYADLMEQIAQTEDAKGLYDAIGKDIGYISDATKLCKTVADIVKTVSMYSTLNETSKATEAVLKTICDNCPTDNAAMLSASKKVYEYITGALTENMIIMMEGGEAVFSTAFDEIVGKLWSAALTTALGSFGTGVLIGQAVGKAISNFAFSTDATIDKYYAMNALVQFEDVIVSSVLDLSEYYKNNETAENADNYLHSIELMLATYNLGCDYTNDFAEIVFEKGFVNSVKNMFGKSQTLTNMQSSITSMKCSIEFAYGLVSIDTYKYYLNEDAPALYDAIYGNNVSEEIPIRELQITQIADLAIGDEGPTYDFFSVKYLPQDNTEHVFGETVTSSDENVITVDNSSCIGGYLTAVGEGTCTLTFTSYNGKNSVSIDIVVDDSNLENDDVWDYSGKCGDDIIWTLNITTGNLVISGNGAMYNYSYTSNGASCPTWSNYRSYIKNVIINDGVTRIGSSEFYGCINLERVSIPESVISIGDSAFYKCSSLIKTNYNGTIDQWAEISFSTDGTANPVYYSKNLYIDNKLVTNANFSKATKINLASFEYCNSLTNVTISDSVTCIGTWAFYGCKNLKSVVIGNNITDIGDRAFQFCTNLINITIGNSVVGLSAYMFYGCDNLTSVMLGNGITYIGYEAFFNCKNLKEIMIPNSVNSIGKYAFDGCASLQNVFYSGNETSWEKISKINNEYADNCLESANIYYNCCYNCYSPNWDSGEISKATTCQETGIMTYTCTNCGTTKTETIDKLDHKYHKLTTKNPTCNENGVEYFECSVCGDIYERTPLYDITIDSSLYPESSHNYSNSMNQTYDFSYDGAKKLVVTFSPETNVENNYDYIYIYDDENNQIGKYTGTSLASQSFTIEGDSFSIKLTSDSSNTYYGFSFSSIVATIGDENATDLLATGHNYVSTVTEPTCTEQGYTTCICSACGEQYICDYVPATGHNYVDNVCVKCGKTHDVYDVNIGNTYDIDIDLAGDKYYLYFIPKNDINCIFYSTGNYDTYVTLYDENMNRLRSNDDSGSGRNFSLYYEFKAGNTYLFECRMYSSSATGSFQVTLEQHEHSYSSEIVEPTCTSSGYTQYSCSCGYSYTSDYISSTGHNYVDNVCINCGVECVAMDIFPNNTYDIEITEGGQVCYLYFNPEVDGSYIFYLSSDYDTYVTLYDENMNCLSSDDQSGDNNNFLLSYNFEAGKTYIFACKMWSSAATGNFQITLEQHEHSYSSEIVEPTCTSSGYTQYSCSCGYSYTSDYVSATGHNYVDDICSICGRINSNFEYELLDDGTISITQYTGTEINVIVPSSIGEYNVKEISSGAFDYLDFLESITFSEGIESVYCNCLNCTNLETVNIPSTVNYLSEYSFTNETINEFVDDNQNYTVEENSGSLKAINISSENPYYCSLDGVVFSKNMEELIKYPAGKENTIYEIPNSVKSFSSLAFIFCGNINKLVIPASVESIENEIFGLSKHIKMDGYQNIIEFDSVFQEFEVSADNANYCSVDGVLYTKNMDTLVAYPNGKTDKKFVTDDKVEKIGQMAFTSTLVENVNLSNVQIIEDQAFCQSGFLKNVTLSDNCSYIGNMSFAYCSKLTNIIIPDSATVADFGTFACCINLEKVVLPSSIEKVSDMMFIDCVNLSEIYIPTSVTSVEQSAFGTCEKLQTVYFGGTEEEWNNITIGEGNEPLKNATVIFNSSPDIIVNVDSDTLSAAVEKFSEFNSADYSIESYNNLKDIVDRNKEIIDTAQSQQEIDNAVTEILEAIYNLQPYLNLDIAAPNGTFTVSYNGETNSNNSNSLLFGTNVTVSATANDGYEFVGWYDTVNNLYFSKNTEYSFNITTNTSLTAVFVEEQSATLTFTTYTNWVKSTVTKTIDEWNSVSSIDDLLPAVPYKYGYSNGRWVYDNAEVLAKLQTGENVSLIPEYDEDDTSLPTPPLPDGETPALDLYYKLDADANVGSFVMAAGIPENCQIESVGVLFYYKNAEEFDPTKFELLINNKMLAGRFNTDEIEDIYIINLNNMTARYNFAARGYVTYYTTDGVLKTVYSNQVNIVNREQV